MALWYPARLPRERRGTSNEPTPYRHFISVAKIVEVLQGTELPEALGWEYQLKAGEAAPGIMGGLGDWMDWRNRAPPLKRLA